MRVIVSKDEFIQEFLARIPENTAATFDKAQLAAVKMAFGARSFGAHTVDVRRSIPFFRRRFYLVWLMGWESRGPDRITSFHSNHPLVKLGNAIAFLLFFGILLLALIGGLYALKTALGIDVFPGIDMLPDEAIQSIFQ